MPGWSPVQAQGSMCRVGGVEEGRRKHTGRCFRGRPRGHVCPEAFERPSVSFIHVRGPGAPRGGRRAALGAGQLRDCGEGRRAPSSLQLRTRAV